MIDLVKRCKCEKLLSENMLVSKNKAKKTLNQMIAAAFKK